MARWILNRPPENCNETELRAAQMLRNLSDQWVIRWGYYYLDNREKQREGDFLILGPNGGMLVLEVKSSIPRTFTPSGRWEQSKDRDHPLYQLDQQWSAVLREVNDESKRQNAKPPYVIRAIGVPTLSIGNPEKLPFTRDMLIDREDFSSFDNTWKTLFTTRVGPQKRCKRMDNSGRQIFFDTFGKNGDRCHVKHFVKETDALFLKHHTRHFELLDAAAGNDRLLIEGGTGSGKTWHALEQAYRFAERYGEVLLLCYNLALANFLKELLAQKTLRSGKITILAWEELAQQIFADRNLPFEPPANETDDEAMKVFYRERVPGEFLRYLLDPPKNSKLKAFDALVVDEAQDHDTSFSCESAKNNPAAESFCGWWSAYWALLKRGHNAPMALFYDAAQRPPFRGNDRFEVEKLRRHLGCHVHLRLPKTLRYTQPIFDFLASLEGKGTDALRRQLSADPESLLEGPEVDIRRAANDVSAVAHVESILKQWKNQGICHPDEVLILHAPRTFEKTALAGISRIAGKKLVPYEDRDKRSIAHLSIHRAKGLDALGVIMIGLPSFSDIIRPAARHTYFMGASRARQVLGIVHCDYK